MISISLEKNLSPRGGVTYTIDGSPESFSLTHRTIVTWEAAHGGIYQWLQQITEDGVLPKFEEVRDILIGSYLSDDNSKEAKDRIRNIVQYFDPQDYLSLSIAAMNIVQRAFHPDVALEDTKKNDVI